MPEQLLGRILRVSSNPGDVVLDPFAGSGTTLVVAKKLGRRWLGFELSPAYAAQVRARLDATAVGQPLEGAEEPRVSAPPTRGRCVLDSGHEVGNGFKNLCGVRDKTTLLKNRWSTRREPIMGPALACPPQ